MRRPKVGVVLGGAGIRGFAGLPLIDLLARERIKVDLIVGNSGGAFLAALWSGGYNLNQIKNLFLLEATRNALKTFEDQRKNLFRNTSPETFTLGAGIYKPDILRRVFDHIFKDLTVEELTPSTVITAMELRSGEPAAIESGSVADAVYAAGALYPLMPPLRLDDLLLADGSYCAPLPVMEAVKRGMDIIIAAMAVDRCNEEPVGFLDCFMHVTRHAAGRLQKSQSALSVDLHHHEILHMPVPVTQHVSFWDIEKLGLMLEKGDLAAQNSLPEIQRQIESFRAVQMRERRIC